MNGPPLHLITWHVRNGVIGDRDGDGITIKARNATVFDNGTLVLWNTRSEVPPYPVKILVAFPPGKWDCVYRVGGI